MSKKSRPKVYAFIDSQNLNLGSQRMGWKVDWRRFRQFLQEKYNVTQAYMFIGYMSENESLYEYMHELGYLVVLKPSIDVMNPDNGKDDKNGNHEEREKTDRKGQCRCRTSTICHERAAKLR